MHLSPRIRNVNSRLSFAIAITIGEYVIEHLIVAYDLLKLLWCLGRDEERECVCMG